jgi:hypothetical protein
MWIVRLRIRVHIPLSPLRDHHLTFTQSAPRYPAAAETLVHSVHTSQGALGLSRCRTVGRCLSLHPVSLTQGVHAATNAMTSRCIAPQITMRTPYRRHSEAGRMPAVNLTDTQTVHLDLTEDLPPWRDWASGNHSAEPSRTRDTTVLCGSGVQAPVWPVGHPQPWRAHPRPLRSRAACAALLTTLCTTKALA